MTATSTALDVPDGFFEEVSALLRDESAEEIADTVMLVCTSRGILTDASEAEDDDATAELERARQIDTVFDLLDATTDAVADGRVTPRGGDFQIGADPTMAQLWSVFASAAHDPAVAQANQDLVDGRTAAETAPPADR